MSIKANFVFINYLNRSGSTLLCKLLDQYEDIAVGIEAGFPGAISRLIPVEFEQISNDQRLAEYLDILFEDIRFKEWNIDKNILFNKLKNTGYPLTFKEILGECMSEYFGNTPASFFVHKAGYYIDILNDVQKIFGDAKNIFIVRDPRAIYNSQKNATCIYTGKSMGHSLPYFVYQYKKRAQLSLLNKHNYNFLCVRYEDLITDTQGVIDRILRFLNVKNQRKNEKGNYAARIPDNQQSLHTNVQAAPNTKSIEKWKTGLRNHELLFVQNKLLKEMELFSYNPVPVSRLALNNWLLYFQFELEYLVFLIKLKRAELLEKKQILKNKISSSAITKKAGHNQ